MPFVSHQDHIQQLRESCSLFSSLSERHLLEMEAAGSIRTYTLEDHESIVLIGQEGEEAVYLLNGKVNVSQNEETDSLQSGKTQCRPIRLTSGSKITFEARAPSMICRADREQLDYLIGWNTMLENMQSGQEGLQDILEHLKHPAVFMHLPFSNVEEAFRRMKKREVNAGDRIMEQGGLADNFYIIENGRAEVWQQGLYDDEPVRVAELSQGHHFGDDALVMGGTRNAGIRIVEDGTLLVLSGEDFRELIQKPMVKEVDAGAAKALVDSNDRKLLDVRYEEEWEDSRIPGVTLIPLHELRDRMHELDADSQYITYCLSGKRSAVAAMIMKQNGVDAICMRGGMRDWPYETESSY